MSLFGQSSGSSLFSQKPQSQQSPSLLGPTQSAQTASGFGSGTQASQPAQSGGLFGSAVSQPQQSSGLFGSSASQSQPAGGLFGTSTSQPQQTRNLFGSTTASQQQQGGAGAFGANTGQAQPQQTGFFGNAQQQQGASLFGKTMNSTQPNNQTGSLFGSSSVQQNKPTLSLFPTQNQQPQQTTSLFANTSTSAPNLQNQTGALFSSTATKLPALGQTQQQQQSVPGVRIDVSQMRGTTRFIDLHDELQKQVEQIDAFIQKQISYKEQCDAMMPAHGENVESISTDVKFLNDMVKGVEGSTESNARAIGQLKDFVNKDADDARLSFRAVENLKLPSYFHYGGSLGAGGGGRSATVEGDPEGTPDLISFFSASASDMSNTLSVYEKNIGEIESHLKLVEANAITQAQQMMLRRKKDNSGKESDDQVKELALVLREFESGIMGVAGRVGQLRESMQELALNMYK